MYDNDRQEKTNNKLGCIVTFLLIIIVTSIGVSLFILKYMKEHQQSEEVQITTISETSLEKIVSTSQLSTMEYTYNGVAKVTKKNFDTIKYYVAYEGVVKAGIDFTKIDISLDKDNQTIIIRLPDVEIQSVSINTDNMEYIFEDSKYNTETVASEAYKKCKEDLKNRAENEVQLVEMTKENASATITALIEPWITQVEDYKIDIIYGGEDL
ncbi:MAG: DUF4230 domain-containing protein [Eubacteriales bacterium]|nr:DUF4230 domain-containing protein [Eubacteriales bacterium]